MNKRLSQKIQREANKKLKTVQEDNKEEESEKSVEDISNVNQDFCGKMNGTKKCFMPKHQGNCCFEEVCGKKFGKRKCELKNKHSGRCFFPSLALYEESKVLFLKKKKKNCVLLSFIL